MKQLLLLGWSTIHEVLERQAYLKNYRQLPTLPRAIRCILLYFSLPQTVEIHQLYRVMSAVVKMWLLEVLVIGFLSVVDTPRCCLGNRLFPNSDVGVVTAL